VLGFPHIAGSTMSSDDDFRVRPGRIRSTPQPRARSFLQQALRAAQKAGGHRPPGGSRRSTWGRGRSASLCASRALLSRSRGAVIKARVVRQRGNPGGLRAHLAYLQRDGVTRDGQPGELFDAARDGVDAGAFSERCEGDRHHFRFIVSPDDAGELADLRDFTRDLMANAERDLGTKLDWVAVDHWNTEHPHVHVLVRGKTDQGDDLVISRDYISSGMRDRAAALVTQELGPRTEREVRRDLTRQVEAERWTQLDRALARDAAGRDGVVDLRRERGATPDPLRDEKLGRLRKLARLGLAEDLGGGRFTLADDAEAKLRALGERGDIIKRLHRAMARDGREADASAFVLEGETAGPVIGRLVARGLDDELKGSAYAVVEGVDGRTHHLRFADLDAAGDGRIGSVVELRRYEDARGRERVALAVRSDLTVEAQVTASGATWLDRQALAREPAALGSGGFGGEVRDAMVRRAEHLTAEGLARRQGQRIVFASDLLDTLRRRELGEAAGRLAAETGLAHRPTAAGEHVGGVYRQRLQLASGRFAMLDDGLGFQLVPWSPSLEKRLGQQVAGVALPGGGVDWSFGRKRGLSL
jgi:type IV secretory pathway VirD2 relaxase